MPASPLDQRAKESWMFWSSPRLHITVCDRCYWLVHDVMYNVYPGVRGWSSIIWRHRSRAFLNLVISQFDSPLINVGSKLNKFSVSPRDLKQVSLSFSTRVLHPICKMGLKHNRPRHLAIYVQMPMFGTSPSIIFYTYIIIYCSRLLSSKYW